MPFEDPDPTDPMTLHGVVLEAEPTLDAVREMAECFVEEYARMGFDAGRILGLFRNPGYAGPYQARERLGDHIVRSLVEEITTRWGRRLEPKSARPNTNGEIGLSVLHESSRFEAKR